MIDTELQERFTRSCTDAAFGYTAATTAAYAAWADQVLGFWAKVFEPPRPPEPKPQTFFGWPLPLLPPAPQPAPPPPNPLAAFGWPMPQWPSAPSVPQFPFQSPAANPYMALFNMFPFATPAGSAWPMAFMMIAAGMPQSVAWPTAKANAAVMDAADVAAVSVQKAFSSYRTESGHAAPRGGWPVANLMMLAVLVPLNINAMLGAMRVG